MAHRAASSPAPGSFHVSAHGNSATGSASLRRFVGVASHPAARLTPRRGQVGRGGAVARTSGRPFAQLFADVCFSRSRGRLRRGEIRSDSARPAASPLFFAAFFSCSACLETGRRVHVGEDSPGAARRAEVAWPFDFWRDGKSTPPGAEPRRRSRRSPHCQRGGAPEAAAARGSFALAGSFSVRARRRRGNNRGPHCQRAGAPDGGTACGSFAIEVSRAV